MAVGAHPDVAGKLTVGAPCASCGGRQGYSSGERYQEYGGLYCPTGLPLPPCGDEENCTSEDDCFVPSTGGTR